jgi:hypothetical protein
MNESDGIDQIVRDILGCMSLKEKACIANLGENDLSEFHQLFDGFFSVPPGGEADTGKDVIHRIWEALQKTHRVRCVK